MEPDPVECERLSSILEGQGFQTLECPGPTRPDYTCLGVRSGRCPLASEDAVVVLDTNLDSEAVGMGTAAEDLLGFYLEAGHPVVALGSRQSEDAGRMRILRRHPETDALLDAVWRLASPYRERQPQAKQEAWG